MLKQIVRLLVWGGGSEPEPAISVHATLQGALGVAENWLAKADVPQDEIKRVLTLLRADQTAYDIKCTDDSWMLIEAHEVEA